MNFSKIIIINLEKRTDRKKNMENLFNNILENKNYFFYKAIDGQELEVNVEIESLFKNNDFQNRKSFIGCAMSHYNLWLELLKDNLYNSYIIFEDDIEVSEDFNEKLQKIIDFKTDILFLGYTKYNKELSIVESDIIDLDRNNYMGGLFGYIIHKSGAQKMIDYIDKNNIQHGIDYLIKINNELKLSVIEPNIVFSNCATNNNNVDSNIQRNYESFDFHSFKNDYYYNFYKNLDQINNDYKFIKDGENNINLLFNYSNNEKEVDGFNTIGFTKSKIKEIDLKKSNWMKGENGIYIKMNKILNVAMICNHCDTQYLCNEFNNMSKGNYVWNNIRIVPSTYEPEKIDYYVIINQPADGVYYDESKTIIFQMEPWIYDENINHGVHTWGIWAKPDRNKFLCVRNHQNYYNNCQSQLETTYSEFMKKGYIEKTKNNICFICSNKSYDIGHILRIDFIKYLEKNESEKIIDIYGRENYHSFKNYCGTVDKKDSVFFPYKYCFVVENNSEKNYITEKLWEGILSECFCFYWGAPNLDHYINPMAYIQLDFRDMEKSFLKIKDALDNDLWSKRIDIIRNEKQKILNYYNFFPTVERIIIKDIWKEKLENIRNNTKIFLLENSENKKDSFRMMLKDLGFKYEIISKNVEYTIEENKVVINGFMKYLDIEKINTKENKFIDTLCQIKIYEKIILDGNKNKNYFILDESSENILSDHPTLSLSNVNNLLNHLYYLPVEYDICYISDSKNNKFKLTEKENSVYFKIRKYFFWGNSSYIASYKGIEKIIFYLNNTVKFYGDELFYKIYNEIDDFQFYSSINI
jgi:GR25 family glycosyltransferase involved in LPS biosynthesis